METIPIASYAYLHQLQSSDGVLTIGLFVIGVRFVIDLAGGVWVLSAQILRSTAHISSVMGQDWPRILNRLESNTRSI